MIKNLLLTCIRGLLKNRYYTLVNIIGLGIGLASYVLIDQYIVFEKSFDLTHPQQETLYRITSQKTQNGEVQNRRAQAPVILKETLLSGVPEIEAAFRVHPLDAKKVTLRRDTESGDRIDIIEHQVYHGESAFFSLLDFKLLNGNKDNVLDDPYTVVLSKSLSEKLFGMDNPVGKSIRIIEDFDQVYKITGIMEDLPSNTHFKMNLLISFESFRAQHPNWRWTAWDWDYFFTYIKSRPGIDQVVLESKIQAIADRAAKPQYDDRNYTMDYDLQPIADIHLTSHLEGEFQVNGEGTYLHFLHGIGLAILVLAWINFMNLAVARAMSRAAEVGIRSTFGAGKLELASQFFIETGILHFLALATGLILIHFASMILPELGIQMMGGFLFDVSFWVFILSLWVIGVLFTSSYPIALMLGYKTQQVLKGKVEQSRWGARVWKGLVVFQYSVSILLIVLTLIVQSQVDFLRNRDLGISLSQVLSVYAPSVKAEGYWNQVDQIRNRLSDDPDITQISGHSYLPGENLRHVELLQIEGRDVNEAVLMKYQPIDYEYFKMFEIDLLAGRSFNNGESVRVDSSMVTEVILNEAAIDALGIASPEEAIQLPVSVLHSFGYISPTRIRGVVKDFNQLALDGANFPMVFVLSRDSYWWSDSEFISFKINSNDVSGVIEKVRTAYQASFPEDSFQYFFVDDSYNQAYQTHLQFGQLIASFSVVAIFLAVFGLIGISMHSISKKLKEIAIRKVHGASVAQIAQRLLYGILLLVGIGFILALPFSYWLSTEWLKNFGDRVSLEPWMFLVPLVAILLVSLFTVAYHTIKAALVNPITIIKEN
ncbi:MAG: ABC transporter permease [Cyclobacteriaceae bacterium]